MVKTFIARYVPIAIWTPLALYALIVISMLIISPAAFAQVGGGGGSDWLAPAIANIVAAVIIGIAQIAILYMCWQAFAGHHFVSGAIGVIIAIVVAVKYTTVAGWLTSAAGGIGGFG